MSHAPQAPDMLPEGARFVVATGPRTARLYLSPERFSPRLRDAMRWQSLELLWRTVEGTYPTTGPDRIFAKLIVPKKKSPIPMDVSPLLVDGTRVPDLVYVPVYQGAHFGIVQSTFGAAEESASKAILVATYRLVGSSIRPAKAKPGARLTLWDEV